jgi:hypothetical protein
MHCKFNGKIVDQTFQIKSDEETRLFVNVLSGEVTVKYSGEEEEKMKAANATVLKNMFLQILSWTDIKLGQNLEHIKRTVRSYIKSLIGMFGLEIHCCIVF